MAQPRKAKRSKAKPASERKSGPKGGRPPFEPTAEQRGTVQTMIAFGIPYVTIAAKIINPKTGKGISTSTLQKIFADEVRDARLDMKAKVAHSLYKRAIDHKHPQGAICAMFIMKTQFGWNDKTTVELDTNTAGVLVVPTPVTPEQWLRAQGKSKQPPKEDGNGNAGGSSS